MKVEYVTIRRVALFTKRFYDSINTHYKRHKNTVLLIRQLMGICSLKFVGVMMLHFVRNNMCLHQNIMMSSLKVCLLSLWIMSLEKHLVYIVVQLVAWSVSIIWTYIIILKLEKYMIVSCRAIDGCWLYWRILCIFMFIFHQPANPFFSSFVMCTLIMIMSYMTRI